MFHICLETFVKDQKFFFNLKQDKFKKNHRELNGKAILLKMNEKYVWGNNAMRMAYCKIQYSLDDAMTPQCSQVEYKGQQARCLYSINTVVLRNEGENMSSEKGAIIHSQLTCTNKI